MFDKLSAPFPPDRVSWRVGPTNKDKTKGMALAYIDARDVMARLDEVCGPGGWQNDYPHADAVKTVCRIGIKVGDEWIWKADGAGDTDMEAAKGSLSDAFKRAAVRWGIGRYLYDTTSPWVEIEQHGKSYSIKESEFPKLARLLGGNAKPTAPRAIDNAALDHRAHADELISELQRWKTESSLTQWGASKGIQDLIAGLDDVNRERVRSAYGAHLKALKTTPERMAG
jgi:hypothetical protein